MSDNNSLTKTTSRFAIKKVGLSAMVQQANEMIPVDMAKMQNRIGIIFDDSGSMSGDAINQAHLAIEAFVKNCNQFDTALALYPLNADKKPLSSNFAEIALYGMSIPATGGTPLYEKLVELFDNESITRAIAFSDGAPNHSMSEAMYGKYIPAKIPIDTVYIGPAGDYGQSIMQQIAERTGGIFLHFVDVSVMAKAFKYLTPAYRAMLTSGEFRKKIERGEV